MRRVLCGLVFRHRKSQRGQVNTRKRLMGPGIFEPNEMLVFGKI
jgi:hypothetical protein